uniref:Alternative protein TM7SF4 n=1 Tax=Homo sapiens TaxID=9606 RepID=L0R6R1_HUMAN|nr:alternative protein TM7SF4 [Homo sapiens]
MDGLYPAFGSLLFGCSYFSGPPVCGRLLVSAINHSGRCLLDYHVCSAVLLQACTMFYSSCLSLLWPA